MKFSLDTSIRSESGGILINPVGPTPKELEETLQIFSILEDRFKHISHRIEVVQMHFERGMKDDQPTADLYLNIAVVYTFSDQKVHSRTRHPQVPKRLVPVVDAVINRLQLDLSSLSGRFENTAIGIRRDSQEILTSDY